MGKKKTKKRYIPYVVVTAIVIAGLTLLILPIRLSQIEKTKFEAVSVAMTSILGNLQAVDGNVSWRYTEQCTDIYSGAFATGQMNCESSVRFQTSVSTVSEVNRLQSTFYTALVNNPLAIPSGALDVQPRAAFGKNFVVSSAERVFSLRDIQDVQCRYTLALGQMNENSSNFDLGRPIEGAQGTVLVTFTCSAIASNYWYPRG